MLLLFVSCVVCLLVCDEFKISRGNSQIKKDGDSHREFCKDALRGTKSVA